MSSNMLAENMLAETDSGSDDEIWADPRAAKPRKAAEWSELAGLIADNRITHSSPPQRRKRGELLVVVVKRNGQTGMPRPFDRLAENGLRFRLNAFRLRCLPVNGLKTKQCEQGIRQCTFTYFLKALVTGTLGLLEWRCLEVNANFLEVKNCSKASLGSRLNWQAEALRARIDS